MASEPRVQAPPARIEVAALAGDGAVERRVQNARSARVGRRRRQRRAPALRRALASAAQARRRTSARRRRPRRADRRERSARASLQVAGARHAGAPVRTCRAAHLGQREVERVGAARDGTVAPCSRPRSRQPAAGVGQRDQVAGQVAAVHGRDVARLQRAQVGRVVPVVEMAAEALQPRHRGERRLQPLDRVGQPDPAEIVRAGRATADRGRYWWARSGARAPAPGLPGSCRAAACCRPASRTSRRTARSAARVMPQRLHVGRRRHGPARQRETLAGPVGDRGRGDPSERERRASSQTPAVPTRPRRPAASSADHRRAGHAPVVAAHARARGPSAACAAVTHCSRWRRVTEHAGRSVRTIASPISDGLMRQEHDDQRRSASPHGAARRRARRDSCAA